MLHEVLLALVGHTGDVVVATPNGRFAVCEGATFLHASERALVERVVRVGAAYAAVASFVRVCARENARDDVVDGVADAADAGDAGALAHVRGLYVRALCGGLDELLDGYRQRVSQLEQAALTDPTITLASCEHYLDDFGVVLPNVAALCATVQRTPSMSGGALLNALHEATLTGAPVLRTCFERLLFHCHKVFFDMMQSWMAYGKLYDPHGEFFVALQVDEAASDETLWLSKHAIVPANIPQYLTSKMASAVLFVGKAMQVLRHAEAARFGVACEQQTDSIRQVLREIQASPSFHPLTFEISVQQIRSSIAAELWRLVVNGAQLEQHLLMLKDFFLLAKGDVFQTFVEENAAMFREPPTSTVDRRTRPAETRGVRRANVRTRAWCVCVCLCVCAMCCVQRLASFSRRL
jgi:gamma-tubulin complex component 4